MIFFLIEVISDSSNSVNFEEKENKLYLIYIYEQ